MRNWRPRAGAKTAPASGTSRPRSFDRGSSPSRRRWRRRGCSPRCGTGRRMRRDRCAAQCATRPRMPSAKMRIATRASIRRIRPGAKDAQGLASTHAVSYRRRRIACRDPADGRNDDPPTAHRSARSGAETGQRSKIDRVGLVVGHRAEAVKGERPRQNRPDPRRRPRTPTAQALSFGAPPCPDRVEGDAPTPPARSSCARPDSGTAPAASAAAVPALFVKTN